MRTGRPRSLACLFVIAGWGSVAAQADDRTAAQPTPRYFFVDVELRSWKPDDPLGSYRGPWERGTGGCSHGGTYGTGVNADGRSFEVSVRCVGDPRRLATQVEVVPRESDKRTKPIDERLDLTDLRPVVLELARDEDGRTYQLLLNPRILRAVPPERFDPAGLALQSWDFPSSPVILDDQWYVGQIGMSGGTLAGIDIAGVAKCEFSLLPLKDGEPAGTLSNGLLRLNGRGHSVTISGVRNGRSPETLKGGPYLVWVRWSEPEVSAEAAKTIVLGQIELLERLRDRGDGSVAPDELRRLKDFAEAGKPMLLGSSARDVRADELAAPPVTESP